VRSGNNSCSARFRLVPSRNWISKLDEHSGKIVIGEGQITPSPHKNSTESRECLSINYMWGTTGIGVNVRQSNEILGEEDAPIDSLFR